MLLCSRLFTHLSSFVASHTYTAEVAGIMCDDVVFAGFSTWDTRMPPPMKSFLHQYNLGGKTVIPFNTNAGYGVGSGFQTVKELYTNSTVLKGFSIKGEIERDRILFVMEGEKEAEAEIKAWLKKID